jgi:hypothetical protein
MIISITYFIYMHKNIKSGSIVVKLILVINKQKKLIQAWKYKFTNNTSCKVRVVYYKLSKF